MQLLIVNYHYFREIKPKGGIYPLTIQEFENQLEEISKYYTFISENEVINLINNKLNHDKNYCLLTFDDGLKEQMKIVDLLIEKQIPGMFYISTEAIKNHKVLDVHKFHYIRSKIDDQSLYDILNKEYQISEFNFDDALLLNQYRYDDDLSRKVKYFLNFIISKKEKIKFVNNLFGDLVKSEEEFAKQLYMNENDLKILSCNGMLGSHCSNHLPLATLDNEEVFKEFKESIDYLEKIVGVNKIKSVSYPYGGKGAVSDDVAKIAQECGLSFGLTMFRGINNNKNFNNKFMLKRN